MFKIKNKILTSFFGMCLLGLSFNGLALKSSCVVSAANAVVADGENDKKSDVSDEMIRRFHENFNYYYSEDENQIEADAELLREKIIEFLNGAVDVKDEDFLEYVSNYIKNNQSNGSSQIKVVSADEFENLKNDPNYIVLYRGVPKKEHADSYRRGEVYVGGRKNSSTWLCVSSGIFTTPSKKSATSFTNTTVESVDAAGNKNFVYEPTGEVVEYVLSRDAKLIHGNYLKKLVEKLIDGFSNRPDWECEYSKNYLNLVKTRCGKFRDPDLMIPLCDDIQVTSFWNYNFKYIAEFVKNKIGFDFFDETVLPDVTERIKKFGNVFFNLCGFGFKIAQDGLWILRNCKIRFLTEYQKRNREELKQFLNENDFKNKNWIVDRLECVLENEGLLLKLMGFDSKTNIPLKGDANFDFMSKINPLGGEFLVTDWGELIVKG